MKSRLRRFACDWAPPALRRLIRRVRAQGGYAGDYRSWAVARAASRGYDAPAIFEKTLAAARAVRDGQAAWERDSVTFAEPAAQWPLLACLLRAAAANGGRLNVVDFGGAFGSAWWQHREWLAGLAEVRWAVVEQPHLVEAGRGEFANGVLQFFETIDAASAAGQPSVLLLSSVLPYVETPHALMADVVRRGFRHIIIDRTGYVEGARDRLTVQRVSPAIYDASYPCWFFARTGVWRHFADNYRLVAEWRGFDEADIAAEFRGLFLERKCL
jgi:putative methyltransferase (TIGR04325 family)